MIITNYPNISINKRQKQISPSFRGMNMYRFEEPLDEFIGGFKISDRELAQQFQ